MTISILYGTVWESYIQATKSSLTDAFTFETGFKVLSVIFVLGAIYVFYSNSGHRDDNAGPRNQTNAVVRNTTFGTVYLLLLVFLITHAVVGRRA